MTVQLAHAWGVPSLGGGSVSSDAPDIGWQSGSETGFGAALIPLAGGEICGYMGMMGSSMILYPEKLILDHEICRNAYDVYQDFEFDKMDLALDVIANVGPKGHYLREKHTREHVRDFRYSSIMRQQDAEGKHRSPREVALEEFKHLYDTHHPEPLPENTQKELDRIIDAADREAEKIVSSE
jgi:trimethylamine--corrinoid protein Co-methyltransferase